MCKCAPGWRKAVRWSLWRVCVMGSTQNHLHPQPQTFPLHLHAANLPSIQPWGLLHQFKTSHAKRSLQIRGKKAPAARGIWPKHFVPAALHFDANVCQPCRFKIWGRGGRRKKCVREGGRNWGASLWGPDANPKCSQGRKQNSMGAAPATLAPSIKAPSATQKPWEAFPEGSPPLPNPSQPHHTPHNQFQYWPENFRHLQLISKLAWSSAELQSESPWRPLGVLHSSKPVYTVACGWD